MVVLKVFLPYELARAKQERAVDQSETAKKPNGNEWVYPRPRCRPTGPSVRGKIWIGTISWLRLDSLCIEENSKITLDIAWSSC